MKDTVVTIFMIVVLVGVGYTMGRMPESKPKEHLTCLVDNNFCYLQKGTERLCFWGDTSMNCELWNKVAEIIVKEK